jgi:hypothetical protein
MCSIQYGILKNQGKITIVVHQLDFKIVLLGIWQKILTRDRGKWRMVIIYCIILAFVPSKSPTSCAEISFTVQNIYIYSNEIPTREYINMSVCVRMCTYLRVCAYARRTHRKINIIQRALWFENTESATRPWIVSGNSLSFLALRRRQNHAPRARPRIEATFSAVHT